MAKTQKRTKTPIEQFFNSNAKVIKDKIWYSDGSTTTSIWSNNKIVKTTTTQPKEKK